MNPGQYSQRQNFFGTRMHEFEVQQSGVILGGDVDAPDQARRRNQEAEPFFATDARNLAIGADGAAFRTVHNADPGGAVLAISLPPGIPVDEIGFVRLCHMSKVPQKYLGRALPSG